MQYTKKKTVQLNGITKVEFTEIDLVIDQEESMVIIDYDELEKLYFMMAADKQKKIN